MQPASGTTIGGIKDPIMLQNVQEQDYFVKDGKGYTLKGISFSLIIEPVSYTHLQEDLDDAAFQEKIIRVLKDGDHV